MTENRTFVKNIKDLIAESMQNALTYAEYREMVGQLALEGKSTGEEQSESLSNYTRLNNTRMKRFDKIVKINDSIASRISKIERKITLLVLTESWCGDAAPSLPVMNKIAELNPNIDFKVILRDDNLELMSRFLYNRTLSIPKLIVIDDFSGHVLGDWGPRPSIATRMVEDYKAVHGQLTPEFKEELQRWYNKDKGQNTLDDLTQLLLENVSDGSLL